MKGAEREGTVIYFLNLKACLYSLPFQRSGLILLLCTYRFDVVVEGSHEVGPADLQLLRPLHVHLHRGRSLREESGSALETVVKPGPLVL